MSYDWDFTRLLPYVKAFREGALTTLLLFAVVAVLGTCCGVLTAIGLRSRIIRAVLMIPLDVVRAIPPLVIILFAYYALTYSVIGVTFSAFWACAVALSLNLAAFVADLVRSAVASIPRNDIEAAQVLGFTRWQIFRHVTMSLIVRDLAAPLLMLYIGILKATSIGAVIGVREVVYSGQVVISNNARSLETWSVVALVYVVIVLPLSWGARWIEGRARLGHARPLGLG